jgi:hypothetical protein
MEPQCQTNWCWAANGASVGNFYHGLGFFKQCKIVNEVQGKETCCEEPAGCNDYGWLYKALISAGSFDHSVADSAAFSAVKEEINGNRPVCTRVKWNSTGAHFTTITGYDMIGSKLVIQDPLHGQSTIPYASYPSAYQSGGAWTNTYYTKKQ